MRKFQYVEPLENSSESLTITVSEDWIRLMYFPYWLKQMRAKYGESYPWTVEEVITDFVVVNWAQEI